MTASEALGHLARATGHTGFDADTLALYLREVGGLDSRDVNAACQHLGRTAIWFPKLAELRTAINEARAARIRLTTDDLDPRQLVKCPNCQDTRWVYHQCPGGPDRNCGREDRQRFDPSPDGKTTYAWGVCHNPHPFVSRCACAS